MNTTSATPITTSVFSVWCTTTLSMTTCVKSGVASADQLDRERGEQHVAPDALVLEQLRDEPAEAEAGALSARASGSAGGLPARANWTTSPVNRAVKPSGVTDAGPARPGSISCSSVSVARVTTASRCAGPSTPSTGTAASSTTHGVPIAGMPSAAASRAAASKPRRPAAWSRVSSEYGGGIRGGRAKRRMARARAGTSRPARATRLPSPARRRAPSLPDCPARRRAGSPGSLCPNTSREQRFTCFPAPYSARVPAVRMPRPRRRDNYSS